MLCQVGFANTTIQAVARLAGVGAPAIYRRWRNGLELIESAVAPTLEIAPISPSGEFLDDIQRYVDAYTEAFSAPAARVALPALLSAYQSEPERHRSVSLRVGQEVREGFTQLVQSARPGLVDPNLHPDDLLDLLIGSVLYRVFMRPFTGRPERPDQTSVLLVRAMRPSKTHQRR